MAEFRAFAHTVSGRPIPRPQIRIVVPETGQDVTATVFGKSPVTGDGAGVFSFQFPGAAGPLPPRIYWVQFIAPGYQLTIYTSSPSFTGVATISANLVPEEYNEEGAVPPLDFKYVSPLFPVEVIVPPLVLAAEWEYIQALVTDETGSESRIEVPITGSAAVVNLQARLRLAPPLVLVGDGQVCATDYGFSRRVTTTFASIVPGETLARPGSVTAEVANIYPPGNDNDISRYTNDNDDEVARWITPWAELPKFAGHYADAIAWLPVPASGDYALLVTFQDINRKVLDTISASLPASLFLPLKPVRVRVPEPAEGASYAAMTIMQGGIAQTYPLIIRYIHG